MPIRDPLGIVAYSNRTDREKLTRYRQRVTKEELLYSTILTVLIYMCCLYSCRRLGHPGSLLLRRPCQHPRHTTKLRAFQRPILTCPSLTMPQVVVNHKQKLLALCFYYNLVTSNSQPYAFMDSFYNSFCVVSNLHVDNFFHNS
jgi:hypothetical protein